MCIRNMTGGIVLLLVLLASGHANAQVYGGLAYGVTDPSSQGSGSVFPELDGDAGYRVFVGNRISEAFAVEFSYAALGDFTVGNVQGQAPDPNELSDTIALSLSDASVVARLPIRRYVSVYAKVGVHYWTGERTVEALDPDTGQRTQSLRTYDDVDLSAGVGADYRFSPRLGVTLEVNNYKTVDVYTMMAGLGVYASF